MMGNKNEGNDGGMSHERNQATGANNNGLVKESDNYPSEGLHSKKLG
jgi:hypothetical protein